MLSLLHDAARRLLSEEGRISPLDVDITFTAPTKEWIGRLTRPTLNLLLLDVRENTDLRQGAYQSTRVNGRAEKRLPPRRMDVRYMVSGHATESEDEQQLFWRAMVTLMKFPEFPDALLPDELRQYGVPITNRVAQADDGAKVLDIWSALGVEPHPAFCCVVTLPVDLDRAVSSPLVLTRTVRVGPGAGAEAHTDTQIAGIVRDGAGVPLGGVLVEIEGSAAAGVVTDVEGQFTFRHVPAGPLRLRALRSDGQERVAAFNVPSESYDILLG
jgi:hypothetical protein